MANYRETTEVLTQLQAEGKIRDFAWYFAAQAGPNFCIIRGETEALMEFSAAPEAMASNMKAAPVNEGFQWGLYVDWGIGRRDAGALRPNGRATERLLPPSARLGWRDPWRGRGRGLS